MEDVSYNEYLDEEATLDSLSPSQTNAVTTVMSKEKYYNMNHKYRGLAFIFNHEYFRHSNHKQRVGTKYDRDSLEQQLERLHFQVKVYNDPSLQDVLEEINRIASLDFTNHDCLLIAVLTHGDCQKLSAKDSSYDPSKVLWGSFTDARVPTLVGKPKFFVIQACRGPQLNPAIILSTRAEMDNRSDYYEIPTHSDLLIAYSTPPGFLSWRSPTSGTWFIQFLCDELNENGFTEDFLTIMTFVCQRVAVNCGYSVSDKCTLKQTPCINSTLTKLVKFTQRF